MNFKFKTQTFYFEISISSEFVYVLLYVLSLIIKYFIDRW